MGKTIYQGNSSDFYHPDNFSQFMKNLPWAYPIRTLKNDVEMTQMSQVGDTVLTHLARKRIVPRDKDLWSVTVTVHGSEKDIGDIEKLVANAEKSSK